VKILSVVGARPNFIKIAPIISAIQYKNEQLKRSGTNSSIGSVLVHTGQHYDQKMSETFFEDLELPDPDMYLGIGSGSHAVQTGLIMIEFEKVCLRERPDVIVVVGDVNSTLACALAGGKLGIPIAHVEAGLRSFDRAMPEELNRALTDQLADLLFTTEKSANENLIREGIPRKRIFFVGNVMIDTLFSFLERARRRQTIKRLGLKKGNYAILTLHRPGSVDADEILKRIVSTLGAVQRDIRIVFPVHPRTQLKLKELCLESQLKSFQNFFILDPLGYLDFINLMTNARFVLTDSGGIQEETTILGVPCITLRENTERPITVTDGTNILVGTDPEKLSKFCDEAINGTWKKGKIPELWDGKASRRIVDLIWEKCTSKRF
jgi:UDP-N-acetylglucosamine 2-epimerase (non-hydrolysing)